MGGSRRCLVTDNPYETGWIDGYRAVSGRGRGSRKMTLPEGQRSDYDRGYRKGAKDASKDE